MAANTAGIVVSSFRTKSILAILYSGPYRIQSIYDFCRSIYKMVEEMTSMGYFVSNKTLKDRLVKIWLLSIIWLYRTPALVISAIFRVLLESDLSIRLGTYVYSSGSFKMVS